MFGHCMNLNANNSDHDYMVILPSVYDIHMANNQEGLYLECEEDAAAYVRIPAGHGLVSEVEDCITTLHDKRYLSAEHILQKSKEFVSKEFAAAEGYIHGPATVWNIRKKVMIYCAPLLAKNHLMTCAVLRKERDQKRGWAIYHLNVFVNCEDW